MTLDRPTDVGDRAPGAGWSPGICLGFEVHSELPFRYLRPGTGTPLEVREEDTSATSAQGPPILEWKPRADHPFAARVHQLDGGYGVWIERLGWYRVDLAGPSIIVPAGGDPVLREERLWGIPTALCLVARGDLPLHASAVDVNGSALLFSAPGRYGKTTLAAAFVRAGHRVLAEDLSCCRIGLGPQVLPGPALLRLRPDVYSQLEVPGTSVVAEYPDRIHLAAVGRARGDGLPVPIRGIVFLREAFLQASERRPMLERVPPGEALPNLWTVSFTLPTDVGRANAFKVMADLAAAVPLWNMYRPSGFEGLSKVVDLVVDTCLPGA